MSGNIAGNQPNQQASMQINKLTIEKHTADNEVKNFLRQLHLVHVSTLLNPFYEEEYVVKDDGQKFDIFTKINQNPLSKEKNGKDINLL